MSSKLFQSADTSEQWRKRGASVTIQSSIIPSLSLSIWTQAQRNVSKTPWKVLEGEQPFKRPLFLSWNKCTSHSFKFDLTTRLATPVIADPRPRGNGRNEKFSYLFTLIAQVHRSNSRLSVCKLATRIPRETMRYFRRRRRNKNGNWQGPLSLRDPSRAGFTIPLTISAAFCRWINLLTRIILRQSRLLCFHSVCFTVSNNNLFEEWLSIEMV